MKTQIKIYFIFLFFLLCLSDNGFAKEENEIIKFIHLSDTHINYEYLNDKAKLRRNSSKLFLTAINQINNIPDLDFVLNTGDIINKPKEDLLEKFLVLGSKLKYPLYGVFGNHDVSPDPSINKSQYVRDFNKIFKYSFTEGMTYYVAYPNSKVTIICLDTTGEQYKGRIAGLGNEQMQWFEKQLELNKNKVILIAMHLTPVKPYSRMEDLFVEPDRIEFLNLINKYSNVIGVFTGDYHIAKLYKKDGKVFSIAPATVKYPCSFREVTIAEGKDYLWRKINKEKVLYVNFKWHVIDEPELVQKSRKASRNKKIASGARRDRKRTFKVVVKN